MNRFFSILSFFIFFTTVCFSQYPENKDILNGMAKYHEFKYDEAVAYFTKALENANDEFVFVMRAKCYYANGRYEAAIADFEKAEKSHRDKYAYNIAKCYAMQKNAQQTANYLKRHIESKYCYLESKINAEKSFNTVNHTSEWYEVWDKVKYSKYEQRLNEVYYDIENGNIEEAILLLDDILYQYPNKAEAWALQADLLVKNNDFKGALSNLKEAIKIRSTNETYYLARANVYMRLGRYKKALDDINFVIKKQEYNLENYVLRAKIYRNLNKPDKAIADIEFLKYYLPNDKNVNFEAGLAYLSDGNTLNALPVFNQLIKEDVSQPEYFKARGEAHIQAGLFEKAVYDFAMALDLNPNDAEAHYKKGVANLQLDKRDKAQYEWETALRKGSIKAGKQLNKHFPNRKK